MLGAGVVKWLSFWLAKKKVRGSIHSLAATIFRNWSSNSSKSRYSWNIVCTCHRLVNNKERIVIVVKTYCFPKCFCPLSVYWLLNAWLATQQAGFDSWFRHYHLRERVSPASKSRYDWNSPTSSLCNYSILIQTCSCLNHCSAQLDQVHRYLSDAWPYFMKMYNLDFFLH